MQADGNLVLYDARQLPLWNSNTFGNNFLVLQNNGQLAIYQMNETASRPIERPIWVNREAQTGTSGDANMYEWSKSDICFQSLDSEKWMKLINDSMSIRSVSMPGTHDSAAFNPDSWTATAVFAKAFVQTQIASIFEQLASGIRFLDIRCRHYNNTFPIHHGNVFLGFYFDTVLFEVTNFLRQNPTETVLMRISSEHDPADNTREFTDTLRSYISARDYSDFVWKGAGDDPTLGMVRGKIVFLNDGIDFTKSYGLIYKTFYIQDDYEPNSVASKIKSIKTVFDSYIFDSKFNVISYLTANNPSRLLSVRYFSDESNKFFANWIESNKPEYVGIIPADYPDKRLISDVILTNPTKYCECGDCYGACRNCCCNTCDDVRKMYGLKSWKFDQTSVKQCLNQ